MCDTTADIDVEDEPTAIEPEPIPTGPKPGSSVPGLSSLLRFVVLATAPYDRVRKVTLDELGITYDAEKCLWCGEKLEKQKDQDHVFGVVKKQRWTGAPKLTIPAHPRCNQGRDLEKSLDQLFEKLSKEGNPHGNTPEVLRAAPQPPQDVVDQYNGRLREFIEGVTNAWDNFVNGLVEAKLLPATSKLVAKAAQERPAEG